MLPVYDIDQTPDDFRMGGSDVAVFVNVGREVVKLGDRKSVV